MRVLFVCSVSASHLIPMVPLAWALRAAGHDVRVACSADSAPGALATGLTVTLVGGDGDFAESHRRSVSETSEQHGHGGKDHLVNLFARSARDMMDGLFAVVDNWQPDAVVYEPVAFAAEVVAAARPVVTFRHLWGPDLLATTPGQWLRHRVHESLADEFHARGAAPADFHDRFVIDPCPQDLQHLGAGTAIPVRYVPVDRPGPVPPWLIGVSPADRICVTWGTFGDAMPNGHPFVRMLERLAGIGKEILLVVPPADLERLPQLPEAVRPVTGAPLHAVLPACSAILHHGGANTMLDAVSRGIPQLVVSDTFERSLNGERLAATGAGTHLTARQADGPAVERAVVDMLASPQWALRAEALRAQMASRPSPAEVASVLQDLSARKAALK
ncbi:glycosyl transferase [Kitasatospora phosalacinea]|uniref:Glycosyl transferase n=1 Tax=Kitasatospora phosalacinea TaxID=2065 RepID=A0A9W6QGA6_9ACTN|nr:nucleotide disphospho-sugar-binding domain-containing protein [Kitasatospora phosalacinea]GLW74436.1 glycosyl transferase [Kitasatospora phosalacinea]